MKILCVDCGCHFHNDFKESLQCSFWERRGLGKLPKKYKRIMWDWVFSLPVDMLGMRAKVAIHLSFYGTRYDGKNQWEKSVEGYGKMTDKERRAYQKLYFLELLGRDTVLLP